MELAHNRYLPSTTTNRLILALLALRIFIGAVEPFYDAIPEILGITVCTSYVFVFFIYLITAILIWRERDHLSTFFIGKLAVLLFIFSKPFQALVSLLGLAPYVTIPDVVLFLPVSIFLLVALWKARPPGMANPPHILGWSIVGILAGIAFGVFTAYINTFQAFEQGYSPSIKDLLLVPSVQLGNASVYEEPLFRGFLWGYLRQRGWNNLPILLVQAGLFWLSHPVLAILYPLSFWIVVPLAGLLLGLIAWRARDIAPGMFAHGLIDGLGQVVAQIGF